MGKVKDQFLARLARDQLFQQQLEQEEDGRVEPELPDLHWPREGQEVPCQDGDQPSHHFIFERSSNYATSLFVGR